MAIKAFTRKTSGPTNSDEFLKQYEELLKRNKGGSVLSGYDTSSQTPIYLGTSVADPTGLGSLNKVDFSNGVTDDYSTIDPSFVDITTLSPEELLQFYQNPKIDENTKLIIEQLVPELSDTTQLDQNIENLNDATQQYENINRDIQVINDQYNPKSEQNLLKRSYSSQVNPQAKRYTGDAAITDEQIAQLPVEYQAVARTNRDNARFLQDAPQELESIRKANQAQIAREKLGRQTATNTINQTYGQITGQTPEQMQQNLETSKKAETWNNIPEGFEMNAEGTGIIRKQEKNDMGNAINELLSFIGNKANQGVKDIRQSAGNAVSYIGDKAGLPEMNWSEKIAGGPTKDYNKSYAAEPETLQAGSGLTRLREDMSYSPSAMAGRPDFSQIGLKRSVGNVAGVQDQSAITGNKQVSPDGQSISNVSRFSQATTPVATTMPQFQPQRQEQSRTYSQGELGAIVDAMMSKGYSNRAEAEAVAKADINRFGREYLPSGGSSNNIGVGSNQPSTQQSQTSSTPNQSSKTYSPTTSNNAMSYSNLANLGTPSFVMPTVGVGSNQPSTISNSSQSNSLLSSISNILANLFRRK
jgi:hypothetical protein